MAWTPIPLTGGVVKSRDAQALAPGELQASTGVRLRPNDNAQLWNDTGRAAYNATAIQGPVRLAFLSFEGGGNVLLAARNDGLAGRLSVAPAGTTGAFADLISMTAGYIVQELGIAHIGNQYFVGTNSFGGSTPSNFVVTSGSAYRYMGLAALTDDDVLTGEDLLRLELSFGGGVGGIDENDWFVAWVTEYDSVNDIESGVVGVTMNSAGGGANVTNINYRMNESYWYSKLNSTADKLRIYRHYCGNGSGGFDLASQYVLGKTPLVGGLVTEIDYPTMPGVPTATVSTFHTESIAAAGVGAAAGSIYDSSIAFPLVYSENQGATFVYPYLKRPRSFDMAVVWNDSLVTNSPLESGQILRYSPPGAYEYQPDPYFMYFATNRSDEIVGLVVVNDRLLVLLTGSVQRVNWLPFESDIAIQRGRVQEPVSSNEGCVGRQAWCKVETGEGEFVVWLSRQGLRGTDGNRLIDVSPDWSVETAGLSDSALSRAVLVNDVANYRLHLYTAEGQRWSFYYHQSQVKSNGFKVMGPELVAQPVRSAANGTISEKEALWTLDSAGTVYTENQGYATACSVSSGFIHHGIPLNRIVIERAALTHTAAESAAATVTIYAKSHGTLDGAPLEETAVQGVVPNMGVRETSPVAIAHSGNYARFVVGINGLTTSEAFGPLWLNVKDDQGGQ